jgi:hypothetical protein
MNPKGVENLRTLQKGHVIKRQCYRVSLKHPVYCKLMGKYGFGSKRKRKASVSNGDKSEEEEFDETMLEEEGRSK